MNIPEPKNQKDTSVVNQNYAMSELLLANTLLPGKGVSLLKNNNSYLAWSVAGYGSLVTFGGMYFISKSTFKKYENSNVFDDRNNFYSSYQTQYYIALGAGIAAVSVWTINYIRLFTYKPKQNNLSNIMIYPKYDFLTKSTSIEFGLTF